MIELKKKNTGRAQLCIDEKYGVLLRTHSSKFFYVIGGHKSDILILNQSKYKVLPSGSVPKEMIRENHLALDNLKARCAGCGKLFRRAEMDGNLCRGFDGCSANAEIEELRRMKKLESYGIYQ